MRPLLAPVLALLPLAVSLAACDNIEKATPRPESSRIDAAAIGLEVPQIMRGTVGGEAILLGYADVVVRGFGLVVGLNGTGSRSVPTDVRAFMIREMGKRGVGLPPFDEFTPDELLDSLDTAVVVVEGVVPAGAPTGTRFDVRVYAAPGTSTTSLEGGRLYSCDLRPGVLSAGSRQAFALSIANGPIFVNPYLDPGKIQPISGRILDGGKTIKDMPLKLRLLTPSHNRASTVQSAVNTTFPREPRQEDLTAHGESGSSIQITVPPSYYGRTREFIELLMHTSLSLDAPEAIGMQIRRAVQATPSYAGDAAWRWQALGVRVLPVIQPLYDYPEERPRLAALQAGAHLNDALVVPHLVAMANSASFETQNEAISLLGDMGFNPNVDLELRKLLDNENVDIRLAAFDALVKRHDPMLRLLPADGKFDLFVIPSERPLIYLAQTGRPTLAVFGDDLKVERPITLRIWDNRLMIKGDLGDDLLEVYYRKPRSVAPVMLDAPVDLAAFIQFLAHRTSVEDPRSGLDLSYGETVGALAEIWRKQFLRADFKSEQDRILAAILRVESEGGGEEERPEFSDPDFDYLKPGLDDGSAPPSDLGSLQPPTSGGDVGGAGVPRDIVPR
ncbi:MAG: flagellar basal body P-ring protein FlgI [Phycisphaerales bacterium]|nr:flagellar basal body P-ring protein FlgI [Phycisphaerales bacterium]